MLSEIMGIHKLLSYIKNTTEIYFPQFENNNNIYLSNVIYFDMTYKLIEIYTQFVKSEEITKCLNEDVVIDKLFKHIVKELTNLFEKLISYNRAIYAFIDYRFSDSAIMFNLLFKDYVDIVIDKTERLNSIPMIDRRYVEYLKKPELTIDGSIFVRIAKSIRCQYELTSKYERLNDLNINDYVGLPYLIKQAMNNKEQSDSCDGSTDYIAKLEYLKNVGKFRYMMLRGAKWSTKKHRADRMFNFFDKDEYVENNVNKTLTNVLEKGDIEKFQKFNRYIPFNFVLYCLPMIVSMIKTKGVYYLGCEVESDFAIVKHVKTYSKHSFPTVYTNDSDLLVLLSDVDCIVKLNMTSYKKTYLLNPVSFWKQIFGCSMSSRVIKILCVLLGTDYNPYSSASPIHIKNFKEALSLVGVSKYSEIDEDVLLVKIYMIMKNNIGNKYCQQTARALNVYLNDIEYSLHYITNVEPSSVDAKGFLSMFHSNWIQNIQK